MSLADLLPARLGLGGRLPGRIDDLRGPRRGVIMLPRNVAWPGMRECDVADAEIRRTMYGMLLTQGNRNDITRLVNADLLSRDWPLIRDALNHRLSRRCERRFGLAAVSRSAGAPAAGART
jgi:hypothetical protein